MCPREKVMRINKMITPGKINALIIYQILSTDSLRKCMEISLENLSVDILLELQRKNNYQEV